MSSGIDFRYIVRNSLETEPPIRFIVGVAWATGAHDEMAVCHLAGLKAVRTAYSSVPGLGGHRELWLKSSLSGPQEIADAAARAQLSRAARKLRKQSPLSSGNWNETVEEHFLNSEFCCWSEIAAHAGVAPSDSFLGSWERLAIAADEWPKKKWGFSPKVTRLRVERWGTKEVVPQHEAARVLATLVHWACPGDPTPERKRFNNLCAEKLEEVSLPLPEKMSWNEKFQHEKLLKLLG